VPYCRYHAPYVDRMMVVNAKLRQSVSALVETANTHQQGLELLARELRERRTEMRELPPDITQLTTVSREQRMLTNFNKRRFGKRR
jgi:hypothetical protein